MLAVVGVGGPLAGRHPHAHMPWQQPAKEEGVRESLHFSTTSKWLLVLTVVWLSPPKNLARMLASPGFDFIRYES